VLGISVIFAYLILTPIDLIDFSKSLISVPLVMSNFYFLNQSDYFDISNELRPLIHTWSLSVEEQFYLIFPILFIFILKKKIKIKFMLFIFVIIFFLSFTLNMTLSDIYPNESFYLLPTRIWEFMAGSIIALKNDSLSFKRNRLINQVSSSIGLFLIIFSVTALDSIDSLPIPTIILPILGSVLIILYANKTTFVGRILSNKIIVNIGLISYSAYLFHQPIFVFSRNYFYFDLSKLHYLILILITFVFAYINWKYIEIPFRRRSFLNRKLIFQLSLIFILIFVSLGAIGVKGQGFENRFNSTYIGDTGQITFHEYIDKKFIDCFPEQIAESALSWEEFLRCKQSKVGHPEIILLGDSHAEHLFIGLAESLPKNNVAFYIQGEAPYLNSPTFNNIFEELLTNDKQQTIFVTMKYSLKFINNLSAVEFENTISSLMMVGKKVYLVGDIPYYSKDASYCKNDKTIQNSSCNLSYPEYLLQKKFYNSILLKIKNNLGIEYIEIDKLFCSKDFCNMRKGNLILYRDNNHLNIYGSRIVGNYLSTFIN
jgi:peptidoglycan/LPS O-acetylase OafA/YrhL